MPKPTFVNWSRYSNWVGRPVAVVSQRLGPMVRRHFGTESESTATGRAEIVLALAVSLGMDLDALAFVGHRLDERASMLDAAEPARRVELERLMSADFDELATAYKTMRRAVERGGEA